MNGSGVVLAIQVGVTVVPQLSACAASLIGSGTSIGGPRRGGLNAEFPLVRNPRFSRDRALDLVL